MDYEDRRRAQVEAELSPASGKPASSLFARVAEIIVSNLQISIDSIHVRIEVTEDVQEPFCIGLGWSQMLISTANEKWEKAFLQPAATKDRVRKILELKGFMVYMDPLKDQQYLSSIVWPAFYEKRISTKTA